MRFLASVLLVFLLLGTLQAAEEVVRRERRRNFLTFSDDRLGELPGKTFPPDGYLVLNYALQKESSNVFLQCWDEVHMDEEDGKVRLAGMDAFSNLLWVVTVADFRGVQKRPRLAPFGDGTYLVAWESAAAGTNNVNLWSMRYDQNGKALWKLPVPLSCGIGNQTMLTLAPLSEGTIAAAWEDSRRDAADIYYQEIHTDGSPAFTPDGVAVERVNGAQRNPLFLLDDHGFAEKLCWEDFKEFRVPICTVSVDLKDLSLPEGSSFLALLLASLLFRAKK